MPIRESCIWCSIGPSNSREKFIAHIKRKHPDVCIDNYICTTCNVFYIDTELHRIKCKEGMNLVDFEKQKQQQTEETTSTTATDPLEDNEAFDTILAIVQEQLQSENFD
jgi:hypothetical protein